MSAAAMALCVAGQRGNRGAQQALLIAAAPTGERTVCDAVTFTAGAASADPWKDGGDKGLWGGDYGWGHPERNPSLAPPARHNIRA